MQRSARDLDWFLRAVHRRWIVVCAVESVGLCVLGGCVLALFVLPILLWRGEPAMPVILVMMLTAAMCGLIAGVIRRPNLMSAAAEADRQLELSDLLSTALTMRRSMRGAPSSDPWAAVVIASADTRCQTLAANDVILNRLGARAWGGIGLASALVLTLGLMSASPRRSVALAPATPFASSETEQAADSARRDQAQAAAQSRRDFDQRRGRSVISRQPGDEDGSSATSNDVNAQRSESASNANGGAGMATSQTPSSASPATPSSASPRDDGRGDASAGGRNTARSDLAQNDDTQGGSSVVEPNTIRPAPPWQASSWPTAREEALSAVRDGRVPDDYRDLVRAYFADRAE